MDGRIILSVGGLCVIILIGAFYMHEYDFEGFKAIAAENEEKCQLQEKVNEMTKASIKTAKADRDMVASAQQLLTDFDDTTRQAIALRDKRDSILQDYLTAVQSVRKRDAGNLVMPEMVLKNGQKFMNVKIMNIDVSGMAITHQNGAVRVAEKDLTSEFHEKYRMDMEHVVAVALAEPKLTMPGELEPPVVAPKPPPPAAVVAPSAGPDREKLRADQQKLAGLVSQATYYHQVADQLSTQRNYYLNKARNLTNRAPLRDGKIHSDPALAQKAEEQAKEIDKQLSVALSQASQADALVDAMKAKISGTQY